MGTVSEGYIDVPGGKIWYYDIGAGDRTPLLCLHGGPGSTHHNLEALEALAGRRRVIFYDQLVLRGAAGGIHDPG
jgi:proline iminopeptidase